jgi:peptidoglycan hydrolase CwlO-like protein
MANDMSFTAIVAIVISGIIAGMSALAAYLNRINKSEAKQSVSGNVIENIIKEIEQIKKDVGCIYKELREGTIQITRIEERLRWYQARLEEIAAELKQTYKDNR